MKKSKAANNRSTQIIDHVGGLVEKARDSLCEAIFEICYLIDWTKITYMI